MSEIGKRIGHKIRKLRIHRLERWTQEDLAERSKISVSFLSMIERGERVPHLETLVAIADSLGVRLSELFDEAEGAAGEADETGDILRPLSDFARARRLTSRDVEKLLGVARAMFNGTSAPT